MLAFTIAYTNRSTASSHAQLKGLAAPSDEPPIFRPRLSFVAAGKRDETVHRKFRSRRFALIEEQREEPRQMRKMPDE